MNLLLPAMWPVLSMVDDPTVALAVLCTVSGVSGVGVTLVAFTIGLTSGVVVTILVVVTVGTIPEGRFSRDKYRK